MGERRGSLKAGGSQSSGGANMTNVRCTCMKVLSLSPSLYMISSRFFLIHVSITHSGALSFERRMEDNPSPGSILTLWWIVQKDFRGLCCAVGGSSICGWRGVDGFGIRTLRWALTVFLSLLSLSSLDFKIILCSFTKISQIFSCSGPVWTTVELCPIEIWWHSPMMSFWPGVVPRVPDSPSRNFPGSFSPSKCSRWCCRCCHHGEPSFVLSKVSWFRPVFSGLRPNTDYLSFDQCDFSFQNRII